MAKINHIISETIHNYLCDIVESYRTNNARSLDSIINESVSKVLGESQKNTPPGQENPKKKHKEGDVYYRRKKSNGKSEEYNYSKENRDDPFLSMADTQALISKIDTERVNVSDLANDEIFPNLTKNGAQSYLRKIFTGERKPRKSVGEKLKKAMDKGTCPMNV